MLDTVKAMAGGQIAFVQADNQAFDEDPTSRGHIIEGFADHDEFVIVLDDRADLRPQLVAELRRVAGALESLADDV